MYKKSSLMRWHSVGLGVLLLSSPSVYANIAGTVFRDFNANGVFDTGASFNEVGMAGVTVKAFDAAGAEKASATSGADGSYTLNITDSADYRVEFSWAQSWLKAGGAGGTSVQFVKGNASNVNAAVSNPVQYCQANPQIGITRMVKDDQTAKPTILSFAYDSTGDNRSAMTALAHGSDKIGTTWGVAYRRDTKKLYASAVLRRHASEGDLGFGGIYELDPANPTAAPVKWFAVADAGILAARGIPAEGGPSHDIEAYQKIGKAALGDIDISDDGKTLYAMNLNTRSLVPIDMATKTAGTPIPVNDPGCSSADDVRPWAVNAHDGEVYVGVVCSDESTGSITSKFKAYVMKLTGSSFTTVASMPLNYEKDWAAPGAYPTPKEACEAQRGWFPWTSDPASFTSFAGCRGPEDSNKNVVIHPQPVLSDIEFDVDGSIVLGFLDRIAMQAGSGNYAPDTANTALYENMGGGDIRRLCNVGGSYVAEGNAGCAFNGGQNLSKNNEFYTGDRIMYSYNGDPANLESAHSETSIGGLALRAGSGEVVMSTYDPVDDASGSNARWATQGVSWLSNTSGDKLDSFEIVSTTDQDFGKASGMGDIEIMCDEAPIEVGNRVWQDTDNDGIQDADEPGIDGVDVVLTCGTDTATVKTADGGQFLFSNKTNATFMGAGESCKITVASGQTPLDGLSVTAQNADTATDNNPLTDVRDSDATATGEIAFTVGGSGENNHTLDIGYKSAPAVTADVSLTKVADKTEAKSGETVVYTLTATNAGPDTATGVQVTDKLPTGVTWNSDDGAGAYDQTNGVWTIGDLAKDAAKELNITVTIK
jgi:uncharacterized repeat protein (TIGR01451 family)